jgi:hypothetical protein
LIATKKSPVNDGIVNVSNPESSLAPEFMNVEEKTRLGLPADSKIQIFPNTGSDEVVYKIIKRDADIVVDPSRVDDPSMIQPVRPVVK